MFFTEGALLDTWKWVSRTGFLGIVFLCGGVRSSWAYPSYIGYQHSTCLQCHFDAYGGGLLTGYGRAVGASVIAGKAPWDSAPNEEERMRSSHFFGSYALPDALQMGLNVRGLYQAQDLQLRTHTHAALEAAEFDIGWKPRQWMWIVAGGSYTQEGSRPWISPVHYVAVEPIAQLRVYLGLLRRLYGIRLEGGLPTFNRTQTGMAGQSQVHGALWHYARERWEAGLQAFAGNLTEHPRAREKGVAWNLEMEPFRFVRVGTVFEYAQSSSWNRYMGALYGRVGVGDGSSLLFEAGAIRRRPFTQAVAEPLDAYLTLQSMSRVARGWHVLLTSEAQTDQLAGPAPRRFRVAPGLLYIPFQRLEVRADLRATRTIAGPSLEPDGIDFFAQVYLWF